MGICDGCHAGCCRAFAIPIHGADILLMEREQNLNFWDFVCRWADPESQIAGRYAPHFHFADEPRTPFVITLLQNESKTFPGTHKCRFLRETPPTVEKPKGTAMCGVYGSRPSACRCFPTKLDSKTDLPIVTLVPESPRAKENAAYSLCHREWEPEDLDSIDAVKNLSVAEREMKFFHQLAYVWNRAPAEWEVFPEFLRVVYSKRLTKQSVQTQVALVQPDQQDAPVILKMPQSSGQSERKTKAA
jgi:Fe-S-cluster containining protein